MKKKQTSLWMRQHKWVRNVELGLAVILVAVLGVKFLWPSLASSNFTATSGRPFADTSPFNTTIGSSVTLDSSSSSYVSGMANKGAAVALLYEFGSPIVVANANTPRYKMNCSQDWGHCKLEDGTVPIPDGAKGAPGSDGGLTILDFSTHTGYCFWQYKNDHKTVSWGTTYDLNGDGTANDGSGSCNGAGTASIAGVVRTYEMKSGNIDHALIFATPTCGSGHRYPAFKSDGSGGGIPEGARVQLDPSVDVDGISGITKGEKAVAHALQKYGAYANDCTSGPMSFAFENPKISGVADPYASVGFNGDYFKMSHIPWSKLRVLKAWNSFSGAPSTPPSSGDTGGNGGSGGSGGSGNPGNGSTGGSGGSSNGLTGHYYKTKNLSGSATTRVDKTVDFSWGLSAPMSGLPKSNFSVRWTGKVVAPKSGTYTFYTKTDDGARLWINGKQLVNDWRHQKTGKTNSGTISLTAGKSYTVQFDMFDDYGGAGAHLMWKQPGGSQQVVPQSALRK